MHDIEQRDRELLNALQAEVPLASTPFSFVGQSLDMSEKEVIKRIERLRRDGVLHHIAAQFDPRALGYRSCLVAARVPEERIDAAAAVISAHPGVTRNYRRNNDLNLWFTVFVSPQSSLGLDRTIEILGREAECEELRPLPTLRMYKGSGGESDTGDEESQAEAAALTPAQIECVRLLQADLPAQPRPFDTLARGASIGGDELLACAKTLRQRGQLRRIAASVAPRKAGFVASAMGLWAVEPSEAEAAAAKISQHRSVSHCYLRPVYDGWPWNLYATVHARSVDECESVINDLAADSGQRKKLTLFPIREYKNVRLSFFSPEAEEWESTRGGLEAAAAV